MKTVHLHFITKTPPAAVLLKKAAGIQSGSGEPNRNKVATVKRDKVREIAEQKMPDLNAAYVEAAMVWLKVLHAAWVLLSKTNPCHNDDVGLFLWRLRQFLWILRNLYYVGGLFR